MKRIIIDITCGTIMGLVIGAILGVIVFALANAYGPGLLASIIFSVVTAVGSFIFWALMSPLLDRITK